LMADILRATKAVPGFHAGARLTLVEASAHLRGVQAASLSDHAPIWLDRVEDLPEAPLFLVANEFLDALPIRQFLNGPQGWQERLVGVRDDGLGFGLSAPLPRVPDTAAFRNAPKGALVEDNLAARQSVAEVSMRIARHGGVAYWVDYGDWRSQGDTLQALRQHRPDAPLAHPGEADLTAHVDFEPLAALAPAFAYDAQGAVLARLGIDSRAARLAQGLTGPKLESHHAAHRRLTHPEEMGSLFKVLAVTSAGAPPPPGFA
ncbi:MAG: class I SAM-dependent methyltransferase, partial [Acetobacteraceae bacterium]